MDHLDGTLFVDRLRGIKRDLIVRRIKKYPAPIDIYEESDMIIRTIRDIFTGEVDAIYIDEPSAYEVIEGEGATEPNEPQWRSP